MRPCKLICSNIMRQVAVLAAAVAVAPLLPGLRRDGGAGLSARSRRRRQLAVCGGHPSVVRTPPHP